MPEDKEASEGLKKIEGEWMIKDCQFYCEEYSDCTSIKARFHQYFIHGMTTDCSQWKIDCNNCLKWKNKKDVKAAEEVIKSESNRRLARLKNHYSNNVWQKRASPPEDWSKPLPDEKLKEYKHTYLNLKSQEMKGEIPPIQTDVSFCSIM